MEEREKIIVTVIGGIAGFVFVALVVSLILWLIVRYFRYRSQERMDSNSSSGDDSIPMPIPFRAQPSRSRAHKFSSHQFDHNKIKKKKKRKNGDTNSSLSFEPPHLINQNVKNLEKLLASDSTLTATSWHYEETLPKATNLDRRYGTPSSEPVYTSSSTVLTSISNQAIPSYSSRQSYEHPLNNLHFQFLNELDHVLRLKQELHNQRPHQPIKYSQSCRQTTDLLPFDYYRSTSPSTMTFTSSSNNNSLEPIYIRTAKCSNATLLRKARMAQLRDDTAILY